MTDDAAIALCTHLAKWFEVRAGREQNPAPTSSEALLDLARRTRTIGLLAGPGMEITSLFRDLADAAYEYRDKSTRANLVGLELGRELTGLFAKANITAIIFKGAPRLKQVYRRIDLRAAHDVDVLVPYGQYRQAAGVLRESGFGAGIFEGSAWWHRYLGESPYLRSYGQNTAIVDLHHRLQQPGAPAPRSLERFFENTNKSSVATVPFPDPAHGLLITVISLSKALRNRDPWLSYAHEIAFQWRGMTDAERDQFLVLSVRQELRRMAGSAIAMSHKVFDLPIPSQVAGSSVAIGKIRLRRSACGILEDRRFLRSRLAWRWTDGFGPMRLYRFGGVMGLYHLSEHARRREERNRKIF